MTKQNTPDADNLTREEASYFKSRLQETPIAVVGMSAVFADAKNLNQYWDNIMEKIDSIIDVPPSRWNIDDYYSEDKSEPDKTYCKRGAFIPELDFDPMEFGLPPNILEVTDIAQLLALIVARDVLEDAGIGDGSGYDRDKVGITLGVGGGQKQIAPLISRLQYPVLEKVLTSCGVEEKDREVIIDKFKKAYIGWEENSFPGMLGNVIAGRVANRFDLGGTNCVVDAACAGSLAAMKLAVSDLLEYRSEMMISGGICCDNSPFMYMSFSKTPAFTTNDTIRPFDENSKGMMVGEGIGMVMLKRLEDAERDGDKIYAVLKGIGTSSDGRFKSIYAPRPEGQAKALRRAYADAGIDPKTVSLIEAHGTGTLAGDAAEFRGVNSYFGAEGAGAEKDTIALGSVKSQIGHTKSAAGAAGFIKMCLALHHKVLPPTINVNKPSPTLGVEDTPFYVNTETRPWLPKAEGIPRRAGVSSFGFGGTNFHFVLEEYKPQQSGEYRLNPVPQMFLLHGKDEAEVLGKVKQWQAELAVSADDKPFAFNRFAHECGLKTPKKTEARLGFVADNADEALAMLEKAEKQLAAKSGETSWSMPNGIYYRSKGIDAKGKTVALFSGQGSQYLNMGRELACNFPTVLSAVVDMDNEFTHNGLEQLSRTTYPIPVFTDEERAEQEKKLQLTQYAQPAIGTMSAGLYKTFQQAGFKADFTAGHSFGELTALWAGGVLSDEDFRMLARTRGQAMAAPDEPDFDAGTMIAVVGDPAKVAEDIKDIPEVSIANYNSNNQVVVAGVTTQVHKAFDELKGKGYKVVQLPVSAAFHTPLVGHAQKPFAAAIDKASFKKPQVPVFANGTGKAHSDKPAEIKKALKNHILESVHFNEEIENIYADGGRIFVEFGPKNVLTKLVENILSDKKDVVAIAINANPKKSSDLQMRQAAVQLAVQGVELDAVDPYQAPVELEPRKMSAMAMKLSAASYVSDKTRNAFQEALNDGYQIKQAQAGEPQVVEKVVEKIVEVPVAGSAPAAGGQGDTQSLVDSLGQSVDRLYQQQQQMLDVHQQFMEGPKQYADTVRQVLSSQSGDLPPSVDKTLSQYHEFQRDTLRVHEQYLNRYTEQVSGAPAAKTPQSRPATAPAPAQQTAPAAKPAPAPRPAPSQPAAQAPQKPAPAAAPAPQPAAAPAPAAPDAGKVQQVMMEVVAEKTGYPVEMLELSMDMEADLGIDSIKRVEILGAVQDQMPNLPELNPEDLAELRTLGQIVDYMQDKIPAGAVAPAAAPAQASAPAAAAPDAGKVQQVMMQVVAEKTGYPVEMLELSMDMEADLGIDSIKRVEILGAVQDQMPNLPELNPEDLAELRTLGQIVDYMQDRVPAGAAAPAQAPSAAPPAAGAPDTGKIQQVMMEVVAEKTGYPVDMLELSMDMEADLGIDSIKRVEILGAVQDQMPNLPELNPEDLAELRTLGQIVDYMQAKVPQSEPAAAPAATPAPPAVSGVDAGQIQQVMMAVVAEKTGYPVEMLELSMDMEADLGIDSIKRVEILGGVQDEIPNLPELNPEDLAELRTLGQIVDYMQARVPQSAPAAAAAPAQTAAGIAPASSVDAGQIQQVMMQVVAEKTGYPVEMLELSMDMEADLGIDSIKRVEILGGVQDEIPNLPELNPEDLAELRTLGQIVDYMQSKVSGGVAAPETTATVAATAVSSEAFAQTLMEVVAEKTGYPVEMLELEMDMEADLGIDSIKRVEILGAVQDTLPDLPEVSPEELAEMRTLSEIVSAFAGQAASPASAPAQPSDVAHAPSATVAIRYLLSPTLIDDSAKGACLIVDDGSQEVVATASQLQKSGWAVTALVPGWLKAGRKKTFAKAIKRLSLDEVNDETVLAAIEACGALDAVIYMHPDVAVKAVEYPEDSKKGLMLAFLLAKHCKVKNAANARATFMVVTRQGGRIGFDEQKADLVQGGLNGLVKTLAQEWPDVFCRAVDLGGHLSSTQAAEILLQEFFDADNALHEVGYDKQGRLTLVPEETDSYALPAGNSMDENSVFLVSGGAKGVTAQCVIRLAQNTPCGFILLGRSPLSEEPAWAKGIADEAALKKAAMQELMKDGAKPTPVKVQQFINPILSNREIQNTLDAIRKAGARVEYVSADVTDIKALQKAVTAAEKNIGKATGVIHGAGVLADKVIEQKTLADFEAVYRTKIDGLSALLSCVDQDKLKHLVLFSSAAGFYGNPAQSDYSIANEILNKTALRFKALHPDAQVLSFNWGPWDGGMVTDALKRMFHERGVYIIPIDGGAELMVRELAADSNRCPQILVGNDMSGAEAEVKLAKKPEVSRLYKSLKAANNPFLQDHKIGDNPVLPTVCAIAWMMDAADAAYNGFVCSEVIDYKLFKGIVLDGSEAYRYAIDLTLVEDRGSELIIQARVTSLNAAGKPVFHYGADLKLAGRALQQPHYQGRLSKADGESADELYRNGTLFHGDSLKGIDSVVRCDKSGLELHCQVPEAAKQRAGDFAIGRHNIFANDLVYQAMLVWVREQKGLGSLPSSTGRWTVYRSAEVGEAFTLVLKVTESDDKKLVADIDLIDDNGLVLAEVRSAQVTASESLNELFKPAA